MARRNDLPALLACLINWHAQETLRDVKGAAPETLAVLSDCFWPGNVRKRQGVEKSAPVNATSDVFTRNSLPDSVQAGDAGDLDRLRDTRFDWT